MDVLLRLLACCLVCVQPTLAFHRSNLLAPVTVSRLSPGLRMSDTSVSPSTGTWVCLQQLRREREALSSRIAAVRPRVGVKGSSPSTLIVLAHGLAGTQGDLAFLKEAIMGEGAQDAALVLLAGSNEGKTADGVARGGRRLAAEILELVEKSPSLTHISLVGNSLGGLYSRYAAALLYTPFGGGDICGLLPRDFVTTATPHLGVRRYTYVPVPDFLHGLAPAVPGLGRTGADLLMSDAEDGWQEAGREVQGDGWRSEPPLLVQMATHDEFLKPLAVFGRRRAYANLEGDALVPMGTAAFFVPIGRSTWGLFEKGVSDLFRSKARILSDERYPEIECALEVPAAPNLCAEREGAGGGVGGDNADVEARMAAGLDSLGWSKVGVRFSGLLPLAHNKIVALNGGGPIRALMNPVWKEGRSTMRHCAAFLLEAGGLDASVP